MLAVTSAIYAGLARIYLKQKNVELVSQTVEKGLAQTNSPRMHVARGELWFRQGKINEAGKEWVDVINAGFREARPVPASFSATDFAVPRLIGVRRSVAQRSEGRRTRT